MKKVQEHIKIAESTLALAVTTRKASELVIPCSCMKIMIQDNKIIIIINKIIIIINKIMIQVNKIIIIIDKEDKSFKWKKTHDAQTRL